MLRGRRRARRWYLGCFAAAFIVAVPAASADEAGRAWNRVTTEMHVTVVVQPVCSVNLRNERSAANESSPVVDVFCNYEQAYSLRPLPSSPPGIVVETGREGLSPSRFPSAASTIRVITIEF